MHSPISIAAVGAGLLPQPQHLAGSSSKAHPPIPPVILHHKTEGQSLGSLLNAWLLLLLSKGTVNTHCQGGRGGRIGDAMKFVW